MKLYPSQLQIQNTLVIPETFNVNVANAIGQINGRLDSQNLPVQSLTNSQFQLPVYTSLSDANLFGFKWSASTQTYWEKSRTSMEHSADICIPLLSYNLITEDWNKGWNLVTELPNFQNMYIEDAMQEGMLNGCVRINFRHGCNVVTYEAQPAPLNAEVGLDWWTRWGVFVNDVLVAESGECYPQAENIVIPFSTPIGSQNIRIDIRWQTWTSNALSIPSYTNDPTTPLEIFGIGIWVRNTYR